MLFKKPQYTEAEIMQMGDLAFAILPDDPQKALDIGRIIWKTGHSIGLEIIEKAYRNLGKSQKAIKLLNQQINKKFPNNYMLLNLLGTLYSNRKQYAKAVTVLKDALKKVKLQAAQSAQPAEHEDIDYKYHIASITYDYALALLRDKQKEKALQMLQNADLQYLLDNNIDIELYMMGMALQADILNIQKSYDEAHAIIKELHFSEQIIRENPSAWANILAVRAICELHKYKNPAASTSLIQEAISYDRFNDLALKLFRQIIAYQEADSNIKPDENAQDAEQRRQNNLTNYRIIITGEFPRGYRGKPLVFEDHRNFMTAYDVVAKDKKEALEFIKLIEPDAITETLEIEECKTIEDNISNAHEKGIYEIKQYIFR